MKTMKISYRNWILYAFVGLLSVFIWFRLTYPQLAFVDLSVDKDKALKKANEYLISKGVDTGKYNKAIVLGHDFWVDRYLQKTLGSSKEEEFIKKYNYDLFYWSIRFFIENQKEEYTVKISSKSGEVVWFAHLIEDTEKRTTLEKEIARQMAKDFLVQKFGINFSEYDIHEEQAKKFQNRTDYVFSWERKDVSIPWKDKTGDSVAKLLFGATVSGNEIRSFYKNGLDIPEKFKRYVQRQLTFGDLLAKISFLLLFFWIIWSVTNIITRKNDVLIKRPWRLFLFIGIILFILQLLYSINNFSEILFQYPTSSSLVSFLGNTWIMLIMNAIFINLLIVLLGISSEYLRYEIYPDKKKSSFLYYLNSTIFSRDIAKSILFGYLLFIIFLGLQSILFCLGQKLLGVWVDKIKLTSLSSSYLPFLAAFIIGSQASLREEIIYRMFGISWLKKYIGSSILAIIISSLIWGFGHSTYPVFPIWFRGIEVGILGIFYGFILLRYGIIPLLVAHYLFDVYWESSAFIFGKSSAYLFISSITVLLIPLFFAIIAFIKNASSEERKIESVLDIHQKYNLEVLLSFLSQKRKGESSFDEIKNELISHGWDKVIVELAIKKVSQNEY